MLPLSLTAPIMALTPFNAVPRLRATEHGHRRGSRSIFVVVDLLHQQLPNYYVPATSEVVKFSQNLISNNYKKMKKTMKRGSSNDASCIEEYPRKKRAVVIKGESKRFKAVSTAPLLEKVDAIAYPHNNMGICQDEEDTLCSGGAEYLDVEDVDGFYDDRLAHPCHSDENTICSDAESLDVDDVDEGCNIFQKKVLAEKIHRASVGGLHALLPMAKYDVRCA
ncbi:hypothetical protein TSUD_307060 [Trifolium subterraneum]|uniref:Uncharacterized protein n=1 Tax=Trifolium subterraneum TaxID=3900 RepID=A0A2Z6NYK3_TRISU|nr:hypothetical protein TSUD_307060 [Trifolium subterraneum]